MSKSGGRDERSGRYTTVFHQSSSEFDAETELSTRVLIALDSIQGYDVENSNTVIFEHIDLDALDELFGPVDGEDTQGRVRFPIDSFHVTVTAAGDVTVEEPATSAE